MRRGSWIRRAATLAVGLAAILSVPGCRSTPTPELPSEPPPVPTAEDYYEDGLKELEGRRAFLFFHDVDHDTAIQHFQEVIDNYPYSDYATLAELKIADSHFDQRQYEEARSYYQDFVELHPSHPKVPYAIYRNGLCSYEQMRAVDRDQEPTRQAIGQFREILEGYPDSEYAESSRLLLKEAEDSLASRQLTIADFYFEKENYHGALERYRQALEEYPYHDRYRETMARMGYSLLRVQRTSEAEVVLREVLRLEPEPELRERIERELGAMSSLASTDARLLPRSCRRDPNPACAQFEY